MISEDSFVDIHNEYERKLFKWKAKFSKILIGVAIGFLVIILLMIILFPNLMNSIIYIIVITSIGFIIIASLLVITNYKSEKPFFEYLVKTIVEEILKAKNVEYSSFVKNDKQTNIESGLFPRSAFVTSKSKIKTEDFCLYLNKNLYITDGKTTQQYFNGHYLVVPYLTKEIFHIRSKGKPYLKGGRWKRIDVEGYRIYLDETSKSHDVYLPFLEKIRRMSEILQPKSIFIVMAKENIHLAYEPKTLIKRPYNISYDIFKDIYNEIDKIIKLHRIILEQ